MSSESAENSSPASTSSTTTPSSGTKSGGEIWADFKDGVGNLRDAFESIDIKESVRVRRELLNSAIEKNFLLAESMKVAMHPEALMKDVHAGLYDVSTKINQQFPYQASLCRTHDYLLVSTVAVLVSFPLLSKYSILFAIAPMRSPCQTLLGVSKKAAFFSAIFTGALTKGATSVVNYKWEYPPQDKH
jgi:hypothetical protein